MWLWIVIGLSVLVLIVVVIAFFCIKKSKKQQQMNAIIYGSGVSHDGDLIEKDLTGKGLNRSSQFSDHEDIMRETSTPQGY